MQRDGGGNEGDPRSTTTTVPTAKAAGVHDLHALRVIRPRGSSPCGPEHNNIHIHVLEQYTNV